MYKATLKINRKHHCQFSLEYPCRLIVEPTYISVESDISYEDAEEKLSEIYRLMDENNDTELLEYLLSLNIKYEEIK